MNTIALDVPESVFRATHSPSFIQQQGARRGSFVRVQENDFLDDFLNSSHVHVFDVAVGDSGTGKSHLIRWMHHEITRRDAATDDRYWVVLVPRSSANLADVVRKILQGFGGETTTRLMQELNRHRALPFGEATNRVIDELAYALEAGVSDLNQSERDRSEEETAILQDLPALLRAQGLRKILTDRLDGIVTRLARHVLGQRQEGTDDKVLRWTADDLVFGVRESERAGKEASELALMLLEDDRARTIAAEYLNKAQRQALKSLLRFRSGDMKAAMAEIRRELLERGKELVVLIEDLSVTEGLDAELVEALQVRTRDTGEELCRLRSIVGVTNDDYARMRENIAEGRTLRTIFFNMTLGGIQREGGVDTAAVLDFASRYLNASRYSMHDLNEWHTKASDDEALPSPCEECPNYRLCHETFGAVDGRGLYPLSPETIRRLYDRVASGRSESDRAFNPRLLVGRVLSGVLEEAEQSLEATAYPRASLTSAFGLDSVRADVQLALRDKFGAEAERLRRALDLYATDPSAMSPALPAGISLAFGLPQLADTTVQVTEVPKSLAETPKPVEHVSTLDQYDHWLKGERLSDRDANQWRTAVYSAVRAWIDWDLYGLATAKSRFKTVSVRFEGQFTRQNTDVTLLVERSPESAIAIRGLVGGFQGTTEDAERQFRLARRQIALWSRVVVDDLLQLSTEPGSPDPPSVAAEFLVLGALLRGAITSRSTDAEVLCEALREWPADIPSSRSPEWTGLWTAYKKAQMAARNLLISDLALTKGGTVGSIIDVSKVLEPMRYVRAHGKPHSAPPEADNWGLHNPTATLAKEAMKHLDVAIVSERTAAEKWLTELKALLGESGPVETLTSVKQAFMAAEAVGRVRLAGVQGFASQLTTVTSRPIAAAVDAVGRAVKSSDTSTQISSLARLDRNLMAELEKLCRDAAKVLEATDQALEDAIRDTGGGNDPATVEEEVRSLAAQLALDLSLLSGVTK